MWWTKAPGKWKRQVNCHQLHDVWLEAGTGLYKVNKRLFQTPDMDNLKLLIPASLECAVKAMDFNFMSSLNTSGSHCRRISLNRSGCPLFSEAIKHRCTCSIVYQKNSMPIWEEQADTLKGVQPGQWFDFKRKLEMGAKNQSNNKTCHGLVQLQQLHPIFRMKYKLFFTLETHQHPRL